MKCIRYRKGNDMVYKCNDIFMVRVPMIPIGEYNNISKCENILECDDYIAKMSDSLLFSSMSTYVQLQRYKDGKIHKVKKINGLEESLYKYMLRGSTRPTPFGTLAGVGLCEFSLNKKEDFLRIDSDKKIQNIFFDSELIGIIIKIFENDKCILRQLKVISNKNCYKSGDRFNNTFNTNAGVYAEGLEYNISIRYNNLIKLILKESYEPIFISDLINKIKNTYPNTSEDIILDTIESLIKSEFIITNLRFPIFCEDKLKYIIEVCKSIEIKNNENSEIFNCLCKLNDIEKNISNKDKIVGVLETLKKLINTNKNFLNINTGVFLEDNVLDVKVKQDLEKFVNLYSKFFVSKNDFRDISEMVDKFYEQYGANVLVPLNEFIDANSFNALKYVRNDDQLKNSDRETFIKTLLDEKIIDCIHKGNTVVEITEKDLESIDVLDKKYFPNSFDMNFFITKNDDNFKYYIGPNFGSEEAGSSFQRFHKVFDKNLFEKYNDIYKIKENSQEKGYIYCEVREVNSGGRTNNVINNSKCYNNHFGFGFYEKNTDTALNIKDLYVVWDNSVLYVVHKKKHKIVKFVTNNMLNINFYNPIASLLLCISSKYTHSPMHRFISIEELKRSYTPRIKMGNVVISPQTWKFISRTGIVSDYGWFKKTFTEYKKSKKIPELVYLKESDNRLLLNLEHEKSIKILYKEFSIKKIIELSEIEDDLMTSSLVKDNKNNEFISEYIFSFYRNEILDLSDIKYVSGKERKILPMEKGWIYFNLYGCDNRIEELINELYKLNIEKSFFYVRYFDDKGVHLRLRIRYKNLSDALKSYERLIIELRKFHDRKLINNVTLSTFFPEVERYGGDECYKYIEEFFVIDSKFCVEKFTIEEKWKKYLEGVIPILIRLSGNIGNINKILEDLEDVDVKKKFHKNKKDICLDIVKEINHEKDTEIDKLRNKKLDEIKMVLDEKILDPEYKKNIILSIAHMYCNRIDADRDYEMYFMVSIKYAIQNLIKEDKYRIKNT